MPRVAFLPQAREEYRQAIKWYKERSRRAALGLQQAVSRALERIAEHPESPPMCDDEHHFYVLKKYPFAIIYREIERPRSVLVVAVAHHSREEGYWLGRED